MISYRGVETVDCVGMQPIVEPDLGLSVYLKPNRFFGTERKRFIRALHVQGSFIFTKDDYDMDLLQQSATAWEELTEYRYIFTYGYKQKLYPISLTFSPKDYPHLAGFQYMKDISLPNYSSAKIVDRIIEGKILNGTIQKAAMYAEMIEPRLKGGFNPSEKFSGQRIYPLLIYASHVSVYYFYQSRLSYFKSCRH